MECAAAGVRPSSLEDVLLVSLSSALLANADATTTTMAKTTGLALSPHLVVHWLWIGASSSVPSGAALFRTHEKAPY
jgi:hypothetical protein